MPNSLSVKVVEDGFRNAVVNIVGVVEDDNIVQAPAITLAMFTGNDTARRSLVGLKVVEAEYSVTEGLVVVLDWNATAPQRIFALSGSGEMCGKTHGGYVPDETAIGADGSINLQTKGFIAGRFYGFTVTLRMVKMYQ